MIVPCTRVVLGLRPENKKKQVYNAPCIVTDYPKGIKAFYMKLNPDGKTVAAMDILVPKIGERARGYKLRTYTSTFF